MVSIKDAKKLKHGQTIYHKTMTNADGTPMRARVTGKVKTWKTRPQEVQVPLKHGMYDTGYLTAQNAAQWSLTPRKQKIKHAADIRLSKELQRYGF